MFMNIGKRFLLRQIAFAIISLMQMKGSISDSWSKWWSYGGISGPEYWAVQNSDWMMCGLGKQQSPINIEPEKLLYDPNLRHIVLNLSNQIDGELVNTGNDVSFYLSNTTPAINVTKGPLSYTYTIREMKFHFGKNKHTQSEHQINNKSFPAEIQFRGYNRDFYKNIKDASTAVRGMVILAVFIEIGTQSNDAFEVIIKNLRYIQKRGNKTNIYSLQIDQLIPNTEEYMTYDGSLTQPGCHESVTWIILNKPIYVTSYQMMKFQNKAEMEWRKNNARPIQALHHRLIRTNIRGKSKPNICNIEKEHYYKVNEDFHS